MDSPDGALAGLARRIARSSIQPVSHAQFSLDSAAAADQAVREVVAWLCKRTGLHIPPTAFDGEPFETGMGAAAPASATNCTIDGTSYWVAQLRDPDRDVAKRIWHTEIVVARRPYGAEIAIRNGQLSAGEERPFRATLPGCVRQIVDVCAPRADDRAVTSTATHLSTDLLEMDAFQDLLLSPTRRLPVVVVSASEDGAWAIDPERLAKHVCGAAHVFAAGAGVTWALTKFYGKQWSVFGGAGRVYWPTQGLAEDNPFRHPIWFPDASVFDPQGEADAWSSEILTGAIHHVRLQSTLPRADEIARQAQAQAAHALRASALEEARKSEDRNAILEAQRQALAEIEAELEKERTARKENDAAAMELIQEAEARAQAAEAALEKARSELRGAEFHLKRARDALRQNNLPYDRPLEDFSQFENWAKDALGARFVFTARALRGVPAFDPAHLERVEFGLIALRDLFPADLVNLRGRLKSMGMDVTKCFANPNTYKNFDGYEAAHGSRTYVLEWHLKYGNSYDLREAFRIYFHYDEARKSFIVGHMPHHLDNEQTN